jgi:lipopolysaccharide transport system ATP-binding protein
MDNDVVIKVEHLSKKFCRSIRRSMAYGTVDMTRGFLGLPVPTDRLRKGEFWSLDDINFEIKRGDTFGLVGGNGSGKSTLLRIINGIFPPDKGKVTVRGRIGALIAVGAGFHPHMTGRENIFLNGAILGMSNKEIRQNLDSIIEFADIGEFLDSPVSTYSSGMYVRLGFAIAVHSTPDIMLVDEILAVGDAVFQRKCLNKIEEMRKKGTTFVLVSHNMQNIEAMCNKAVLIHKGKQMLFGAPGEIIPAYELLLQNSKQTDVIPEKSVELAADSLPLVFKYPDFGTDEVKVERLVFQNQVGEVKTQFKSEDSVKIVVDINSHIEEPRALLYSTLIYVNDKKARDQDQTAIAFQQWVHIKKGKQRMEIDFPKLQLTTGEYKIGFNIFDSTHTNPFTQGQYGFITVSKGISTMLRVGKGTPYVWVDPEITVSPID